MSSSRSFMRYFSFLLSFSLLFNLIGASIAGAAPGVSQWVPQNKTLVADIGELPNKPPKTILELPSKRSKYSTRFLNPDGSFTEEIYLEAQFYQDPSDKKWKKIDNKLKTSAKKAGKFENSANEFKTLFAGQASSDELVSVEKNGKSISMIPVTAKTSKGVAKENEMLYAGLFPNTDARYVINGDAVKEELILHSYSNQNTFTFEIKTNGVQAVVDEEGSIVFTDNKGNKLWYPYMFDASETFSDKGRFKASRREREDVC